MNKKGDKTETSGGHFSKDCRITIAGARCMLGMIGRNYSDEEISDILDILYDMAEEAYEDYRGRAIEPES